MLPDSKLKRLRIRQAKHEFWTNYISEECFTPESLAQLLGCSRTTIYEVAKGRRLPRNMDLPIKKIISEVRRYKVARKAVNFYSPKRTAKVVGVDERTAYITYLRIKAGVL